jgi:hypothetical protein
MLARAQLPELPLVNFSELSLTMIAHTRDDTRAALTIEVWFGFICLWCFE